jgi:hypothetical protein
VRLESGQRPAAVLQLRLYRDRLSRSGAALRQAKIQMPARQVRHHGERVVSGLDGEVAMACGCITDIEKRMVAHANQSGRIKGVVTKADLKGVCFPIFDLGLRIATYSDVELTVEGKKRPMKTTIQHNFCPFCGERYEKKLEED